MRELLHGVQAGVGQWVAPGASATWSAEPSTFESRLLLLPGGGGRLVWRRQGRLTLHSRGPASGSRSWLRTSSFRLVMVTRVNPAPAARGSPATQSCTVAKPFSSSVSVDMSPSVRCTITAS